MVAEFVRVARPGKRILITGQEGSLGETLVAEAKAQQLEVVDYGTPYISCGNILELLRRIGPCDYIINNEGINHLSWIGETAQGDNLIMQTNLMQPYWVINAAVHLGWPPARVVNVASQTYKVPQRCTALYAASKAGLVQMTKVMARELAPKGWVINAVSPGKIEDTKMSRMTDAQVSDLRGWTDEQAESYALSLIPMGRFTNRMEIAELIFRVLDLPPYVNGTVIEAHGGI